ncbi:MAG: M1 family peptidase [Bacteroidetes bacterium]|nr:MAG: M1 family peptidase [Bacteroidota bacterium]
MNKILIAFLTLYLLVGCSIFKKKKEVDTSESENYVPNWVQPKYTYKPSRTREIDILHTKLEVNFDWKAKTMNGKATLTLKPYYYPIDTIKIDAKSFIINKIEILNGTEKSKVDFKYDNKKISIPLSKKLTKDDKITYFIDYVAQPEVYKKTNTVSGIAITDDKGLYFIVPDSLNPDKPYQIWTQGEPESSSCWFPTIDSPNEKSTQEMYITVDKKYKTLSNGELVYSTENQDGTRTDYWKQTLPHAPYLFMLAIGDFAIIKDKWRNIDVNYYVEPKFEKHAKKIFGNTPEMIEFYSKKLNYPYPWAKYSSIVVRDYVSGAMENTSATVFMEQVQRTDRELLDMSYESVLAHELFHHWFGDLVTCESWANLPLNESFADYSEYLWEEYKYGKDAADYLRQNSLDQYFWEAESKRVPLIRYRNKDIEDMFDSHSYAKGGTILHMLRNYVGDEAFFESLSLYLKTNAYKTVEIHNLRLAFEETTGEDLNWFFNQWFLSPGHPVLYVNHMVENSKLKLTVNQAQDSVYTPIYKLPITVSLYFAGKKEDKNIVINQANQQFEFDISGNLEAINFDSKAQLTGKISHIKSTQEFINQYYKSEKYLHKYEALYDLRSKLDSAGVFDVFVKATEDGFWKLREMALETIVSAKKQDTAKVTLILANKAEFDKNKTVKATAIALLAEKKRQNYVSIYEKGMQDSSYQMAAKSLLAYLKLDANNATEKIKQFENEKNMEIVLALAEYYSAKKDSIYAAWYSNKIKENNGENIYSLIQHYGTYTSKQKDTTLQKKCANELVVLAKTHKSPWARYAAYQCVTQISVIDTTYKPILKEIAKGETHERLKQIYDDAK